MKYLYSSEESNADMSTTNDKTWNNKVNYKHENQIIFDLIMVGITEVEFEPYLKEK